MNNLNIFIGYDSAAPVLYNVAQHSIQTRTNSQCIIRPLILDQLKSIYNRTPHQLASTEFSFSRFLVPYLSDYEGWSLFMDNDVVVLDDIKKVFDLANEDYAIMCVKHIHEPKEDKKFLGKTQTIYEKKNWSSFMLFNNKKCKALTPKYVENATGLQLHQFHWLESEDLIGSLPISWNFLAGYSNDDTDKKNIQMIHYTDGAPCYEGYEESDKSEIWINEKNSMTNNQIK
jgi:lipopolysaccharide biosynthesis glycosyltransferase